MILKSKRPVWYLLKLIYRDLIIVAILAILVGAEDGYLLENYGFDIDFAIPAFVGTAIAFTLSFRTAQAYDRWWEARKVWGAIVNDSRTWTRTVLNLIKDGPNAETARQLKQRLIDRQIAWNYILTYRLREMPPLEDMEKYFSAEEYSFLASVDNPNQGILLLQGRDLKQALDADLIQDFHHVEMEECLRSFEAYMGKLERIKNTHFPVLYDQLMVISIYAFSALLSYAIVDKDTYFEASFTVLVCSLFLALQRFAVDLQDPFDNNPTDTPMTAISYSIERGALQLLGETEMPPAPKQGKFYLN